MRRFILMVSIIVSALGITAAPRAQAAEQRCFSETGFCIEGRLRQFWEQNGGLPVFGFPIGNPEQITVDGKSVTAQRFERNRLELHPNNAAPYDVLLGRLGADRLTQQGRDWFTFPKSGDSGGCRVFAETGHAVCGEILTAWRKNGLQLDNRMAVSEAESLALFGLPISGVVTETLSDGKQYQVQWFERARFELHPENPAPYNVLLGLLGNEVAQPQTAAPAPAPAATGPGSLFVPLPKRMFASYMLEDLGYRDISFPTQSWVIHTPFSPGLNDGTAIVQSGLRTDLVQFFVISNGGTMTGPNGDEIGMVYGIYEYTNNNAAIEHYYDANIFRQYKYYNRGEQIMTVAGCAIRYSIGYSANNILGGNYVMRCENKIMNATVFGFGDAGALGNLMGTIIGHFANSFRW